MSSVWITSGTAVIAAVLTTLVATRDLALRRKLESAKMLTDLMQKIDNQPQNEARLGLNPQFALMYLLVEFAISDPALRSPTRRLLERIAQDGEHFGPTGLSAEADIAIDKLNHESNLLYRFFRWIKG